MKKRLKDFIVDPKGQWNHPGKKTYIPNANGSITMRGVKYPVLGIDDQGNQQMMYPDQDYQFPGDGVYEIPIAQKGMQSGKDPDKLYQEYLKLQEEVNQRQKEEDLYQEHLYNTLLPLNNTDVTKTGFIPKSVLNWKDPITGKKAAFCISGVCHALTQNGEPITYFSNTKFQDDVVAGKVPGRYLDQSEKGLKSGDILQFNYSEGMPFHAFLVTKIHEPDEKGIRKVDVFGNHGSGYQRFDAYFLDEKNKIFKYNDVNHKKEYKDTQVIKREVDPRLHQSLIERDNIKKELEDAYPMAFRDLKVNTDIFTPTAFVKNENKGNKINLGNPGLPSETINLNDSKLDEILTQFSNPDFKKKFMKQQQVNNDEYDAIVKNVIGIYGAESKFGTGYAKEPLWLQRNFDMIKSVGPFQINPKMLQTNRFSRKDLFDPVVGSEAAATFLAENLPLLRSRAKAMPGDKNYSENLHQDNYLEYLPYLMNQQGLLKGDEYTKEKKPGRLARFFGAESIPTPEDKLTGNSEYNQKVKDYIELLGLEGIPASSPNVFETPVEEPQYQSGGTFDPETDEFIGFSDELPKGDIQKAQRGSQVRNPIYTTDPNDPRLQAYTDSLDTYNSNNRRNKVIEMLFSRPSGVTWDEYTKVADVTNFPKINWSLQTKNSPVKFIGNTSDGNSVTRQHSFKKPIQPVVYEEPREIISFDNLNSLKSLNIPISDNTLNLNLSKRGTGEPFKPSRVVLREMGNISRYNNSADGIIKEPYKNSHEVYMDDKKGWRKVSPEEYELLIKQYPGSDQPSGWTKPIKKAQTGLQTGYQKMAPVSTAVNSNLRPIDVSKLPQNNSNVFQSTFKNPYQELYALNQTAHARYMDSMSKVDKWPELSGKTVNLTTDRYRGANVPVEYINMLTDSAKRFKIDPYLLYAIAGRESTFGQGLDANKERQISPINLVSGWNIAEQYEPYDYTRFLADNKTPKITAYKDKLGYHYGVEYGDDYEGSMSEMNNYIKNNDLVNKYKKKLESTPQNNYSNPYDFLSEFILKNGIEKYNPGDPDYKNKINNEIALLKKDPEFSKYVNNTVNRTLVNKQKGGSIDKDANGIPYRPLGIPMEGYEWENRPITKSTYNNPKLKKGVKSNSVPVNNQGLPYKNLREFTVSASALPKDYSEPRYIAERDASSTKFTPAMSTSGKESSGYVDDGTVQAIKVALDIGQFTPIAPAAYLLSLPFTGYDVVSDLYNGEYNRAAIDALGFIPWANAPRRIRNTMNSADLLNDVAGDEIDYENLNNNLVKKQTGGTFNPDTDEFIGYTDELDTYQNKGQVNYTGKKGVVGEVPVNKEGLPYVNLKETEITSTNPNSRPNPYSPASLKDLFTFMNPMNWGSNDYSNVGNFDIAYNKSRANGEKEFIWDNQRYSTNMAGTPAQQMQWSGITNDQTANRSLIPGVSFVRSRLEKNLVPQGYKDIFKRMYDAVIKDENNPVYYGKNKKFDQYDVKPERQDAYRLYMNKPQQYNSFGVSNYKPSNKEEAPTTGIAPVIRKKKEDNNIYYKINNLFGNPNNNDDYINDVYRLSQDRIARGFEPMQIEDNVMGRYKIGFGKDDRGDYMSYYDRWDLNPFRLKNPLSRKEFTTDIGQPFEIYDRAYFNDYGDGSKKRMYYTDDELNSFNLDDKSKNFDTLALQKELHNRGYKLSNSIRKNSTFDGTLGDETKQALLDWQSKNKNKKQKGGENLPTYQKKGQVKRNWDLPEGFGGYQKMEPSSTSTNVPNIARIQRDPIERKDFYREREKAHQNKIKIEKQKIIDDDKNSNTHWWNQTVSAVKHPDIESYAQQMAEKKVAWDTQPLDEKVKHYATETAFGVVPEFIPFLNTGRKGYKIINEVVDETSKQLPGSNNVAKSILNNPKELEVINNNLNLSNDDILKLEKYLDEVYDYNNLTPYQKNKILDRETYHLNKNNISVDQRILNNKNLLTEWENYKKDRIEYFNSPKFRERVNKQYGEMSDTIFEEFKNGLLQNLEKRPYIRPDVISENAAAHYKTEPTHKLGIDDHKYGHTYYKDEYASDPRIVFHEGRHQLTNAEDELFFFPSRKEIEEGLVHPDLVKFDDDLTNPKTGADYFLSPQEFIVRLDELKRDMSKVGYDYKTMDLTPEIIKQYRGLSPKEAISKVTGKPYGVKMSELTPEQHEAVIQLLDSSPDKTIDSQRLLRWFKDDFLLDQINNKWGLVPPAAIIGAGALQSDKSKKQLKYKKGGSFNPNTDEFLGFVD